MTFSMTANV